MKNWRYLFTAFLLALVLCKAGLVLQPSVLTWSSLLAAILYGGFFGSPQLIWISISRTMRDRNQHAVVVVVLIGFVSIYAYCGFFPGTRAPSWAGEGHFEVPFALFLEYLFSLLMWIPYKRFSRHETT